MDEQTWADAAWVLSERVEELRADLDLANARVAVLREGLDALLNWQSIEELNRVAHQYRDVFASPDEAATKLLAARDAYKAAYTYLVGAIAVYEKTARVEMFDDGVRVLDHAHALATGPGTSEEGQG